MSLSVGHLGGVIEAWVRGEGYGVPIAFLYESEPLGTAGALRNAELDGAFVAMNGDVLTTLRFDELLERHRESGALATVGVTPRTTPIDYGVVHVDEHGAVTGLDEKPSLDYTVSMGVYAFDQRIVELIAPGERIDFPDLLARAMDAGERVLAHRFEGYWRDIGNPDDYASAVGDFAADPDRFLPPGRAGTG